MPVSTSSPAAVPSRRWPAWRTSGASSSISTSRRARQSPASGAKTLHYLYDFGDGWEHSIKILGIEDGKPGLAYPLLRDAAGRCPPEDVGGPWGYADFLDAIADPGHEQHEDMKEWYGQDFDPEDVPLEDLKAAVADLAKRWNRKPRKKSAR